MTCQTCQSPHHRATECAATSDRTMLYVPQSEVDALRAQVLDLSSVLISLVDALPRCQSCERPALRFDCNLLGVCDIDAHGCMGEGGPEDESWAAALRRAEATADRVRALVALAKDSGHKPATREASHATSPVTPGTDSSNEGAAIGNDAVKGSLDSRMGGHQSKPASPSSAGCSNCAGCACEGKR